MNWFELLIGAPHLGRVVIPIEEVASGQRTEGWFDLVGPTVTHKNGKPIKAQVHKHLASIAHHSSSLSGPGKAHM